jgi:gliding motility-associated-like protein
MALIKKPVQDVEDVIIYNALSPNDDGLNDSFVIKGINKFPDNQVEIYNRWGVKVYDAKSYNESDVMFRGYSDGHATIKRGAKLPTGTYFYILKYNIGQKVKERTGYLYINNQ